MKTSFTLCMLAWIGAIGLVVAADNPQIIDVWPGKAPDEIRDVGPETWRMSPRLDRAHAEVTDLTRILTGVTKPSITIYRPAKSQDTGTSILICPGGGYWNLYWQLQGEEIAHWLNSVGITGIILKYRVPRQPDEVQTEPARRPLQDAQRAISMVRSKAGEWGIDPHRIGIMGFSAGGHLAVAAAIKFENRAYEAKDSIDTNSCRPDFAISVYPGYLKVKARSELAPGLSIPPGTPPVFFAHGAADIESSPENSVLMFLALQRAGIPAELHVYSVHHSPIRRSPERQIMLYLDELLHRLDALAGFSQAAREILIIKRLDTVALFRQFSPGKPMSCDSIF